MDDRGHTASALRISRPALHGSEAQRPNPREAAFSELEASVGLALETYANVHRGTGYNSMVSTLLYERARDAVLDLSGLDRAHNAVVFCSPARAAALEAAVRPSIPVILSSRDLGLPLGLRAVIVDKRALPDGVPFQTGGGTVRIASRDSVVWEDAPDRFEAGTPSVINAVTFAKALELTRRHGAGTFGPSGSGTAAPLEILHRDDLLELSGRELLRRLKDTMMGSGRLVPAAGGSRPYVHLDNAASTPTFRAVWDTVRSAWRLPEDRRVELVTAVRAICAGFFGAPPESYEVIFTSNTTEAINLASHALPGMLPGSRGAEETVVLNTLAEHNSNELPWRFAEGVTLVRTPVDGEGFPDVGEMERLLREYNGDGLHGLKRIRIVTVCGASNVLGSCPDLAEIARIAHRYGALMFVDAAQLAAHRPIRMAAEGIDGLAFSGHKMYAPFGSGGLILRKGLRPSGDPAFERARASGDENVAGVAALGKVLELLERVGMDVVHEQEQRLTRAALRELAAVPGLRVCGITDPYSPRIARRLGVVSFGLKNIPYNLAADELVETDGLGVRTGCFCAHILVKRLLNIHPIREALSNLGLRHAPRLTKSALPGLVRVSFGLGNDESDVRILAQALKRISRRRPSLLGRLLAKTHNAMPVSEETETGGRLRSAAEREALFVFGLAPSRMKEARPRARTRCCGIPPQGLSIFGRPCCRRL